MTGLAGLRVALIERPGALEAQGSLAPALVAALERRAARVEVVHAELGMHRLDERPHWDLAVLKSGSPAALHLAAAATGWGVPCLNQAEATRLTQDKLASTAILERAGIPIARSRFGWLDASSSAGSLGSRPLMVKVQRGSRGAGTWAVDGGDLATLPHRLEAGPYLLMDRVAHVGDDLKVYVAGSWTAAIRRVYPASTLGEKRGRRATLPPEVEEAALQVGALLGLTCFGCDFVAGAGDWTLVDVNAFPGYKGAAGAVEAVASEIARAAEDAR